MENKYFMYSAAQLKFRKETEARLGKKFIVGQVLTGGVKKPFTEMCSSPELCTYTDAKMVTFGIEELMKFTLPHVK